MIFIFQGLADAFILMRYPFESEEAAELNRKVFETIYYGALESSCELAEKNGPFWKRAVFVSFSIFKILKLTSSSNTL